MQRISRKGHILDGEPKVISIEFKPTSTASGMSEAACIHHIAQRVCEEAHANTFASKEGMVECFLSMSYVMPRNQNIRSYSLTLNCVILLRQGSTEDRNSMVHRGKT
jgi:hypothetical protein